LDVLKVGSALHATVINEVPEISIRKKWRLLKKWTRKSD
jgi:hypothetical protein